MPLAGPNEPVDWILTTELKLNHPQTTNRNKFFTYGKRV